MITLHFRPNNILIEYVYNYVHLKGSKTHYQAINQFDLQMEEGPPLENCKEKYEDNYFRKRRKCYNTIDAKI